MEVGTQAKEVVGVRETAGLHMAAVLDANGMSPVLGLPGVTGMVVGGGLLGRTTGGGPEEVSVEGSACKD